MPSITVGNVGKNQVTSAIGTLRRTATLAADAASNSESMLTEGMPRLYFWLRQTVGANGATIIPQFSIRATTGVGTPTPEWLDLDAGIVLPFNVPVLLEYHFPAKLIRINMTRFAGQATTIEIAMGSSPT